MKLFENMSLQETKILYDKIKNEKNIDITFKRIVLDDLQFFTNNFTKDY